MAKASKPKAKKAAVKATDKINTPNTKEVVAEKATPETPIETSIEKQPEPSLAPPDAGADSGLAPTEKPAEDVLPQVGGATVFQDMVEDLLISLKPYDNESNKAIEQKLRDAIEWDEKKKALQERYRKNYPHAMYLLISSDNQIFLNSNERDAKDHQAKLDGDKELVKIELN